jgi:hypothetical protein
MTKYDIGQLQTGDRVKVGVRTGTVKTVHEPQWRDHKTKQHRTEASGADVLFDDDQIPTFIQIQAITLLESKTSMAAMPNEKS